MNKEKRKSVTIMKKEEEKEQFKINVTDFQK
jgi:hypothetical protein